jgi:glycosyltransferase involved in cell wall biosynthesis
VSDPSEQPNGSERGDSAGAATGASTRLVLLSLEPWDDVWRRNQFLVDALLELGATDRVLFVEPPFDWLHHLRGHRGETRRRGNRPLAADPRIVRFQPVKLLPRVLGRWADRLLSDQVVRAAVRAGFIDTTVWINDSNYAKSVASTRWPILYDVTDDWTESGDLPRVRDRVRENEDILLGHCGAVVVCSPSLARTRQERFPDLVVIPNAVDIEHFTTPMPRPGEYGTDRVAAYVGTLHEDRLDIDLILDLARRLPDVQFVFVGPNSLGADSNRRLGEMHNIDLIGARPHARIPAYLQHADVVIIPHVVSSFTESLDPIKAYECLAVGRPTVATPIAGFRGLGAPIHTVERERFADVLVEIIADPGPSMPRQVPTWHDRAEAFAVQLDRARVVAADRPTRVAFIDHCAKLSGGELALVRVLPALQRVGVEAHVILGEHGPLEKQILATGATLEVLELDRNVGETKRDEIRLGGVGPARILAAWRDTLRLRRRLIQLRPDVVHTNSLKSALYGGVAGRLAGIPVVWHIRDRIAEDYMPRPAVHLVRLLARIIPWGIIANSQSTRATLRLSRQIDVIPSPVVYDSVELPSMTVSRTDDTFAVAMIGRLAPWKGQDIFLRAFAEAFGGGPERAYVVGSAMFGEDSYEAAIRALALDLGVDRQVKFVGFTEDVLAILGVVDCVVHASIVPEPFGQVVVEGMAAGLPVIASAEGGPAEVITDGVDGLLCPPGDPHALAGMLRKLEADPALRARLGAAARIRTSQFAPDSVAKKILRTYRALDPA